MVIEKMEFSKLITETSYYVKKQQMSSSEVYNSSAKEVDRTYV